MRNLLVVLVVGLVDRKLVGKRRRTRTFTPGNYDRLGVEIGDLPIFVTPNTLTEASNLLEDPEDTRFLDQLRVLIEISKEIVVDSSTAAQNSDFTRLGLADTALLEVISGGTATVHRGFRALQSCSVKGRGARGQLHVSPELVAGRRNGNSLYYSDNLDILQTLHSGRECWPGLQEQPPTTGVTHGRIVDSHKYGDGNGGVPLTHSTATAFLVANPQPSSRCVGCVIRTVCRRWVITSSPHARNAAGRVGVAGSNRYRGRLRSHGSRGRPRGRSRCDEYWKQ